MENYSHQLFYLEDHQRLREYIEVQLKLEGVPRIFTGGNLSDLETYLQTNRAQAYLLDGNFPKTKGGKVELNAFEAAGLIKVLDKGARIAVFSQEFALRFAVEKANMKFFYKGNTEPKDIADWLKEESKS